MTSLRVAVALHAYGGVYPGTVKSIAAEMAEQVRRNDGVELYWAEPESDALLSRCRSKLVTQAVAQGVDVLVWLDRDIDWTPGDVSDLAKRCAEVKGTLGGAFPYRSESMRGKHFPVRSLPGQSLNVHPGHDEIHEVEFVSGGFVAFWVPALAEMVKRLEGHPNADLRVSKCAGGGVSWFWDVCRPVAIPYSPPREDGWLNYQSDDWCLMWRLRECGFKTYLWMRPLLGHTGEKRFGISDAMALKSSNAEAEAAFRNSAKVSGRDSAFRQQLVDALKDPEFHGAAELALRDALKVVDARKAEAMAQSSAEAAKP